MMANWRLDDLENELAKLPAPLHLLIGSRDRTIPPDSGRDIARRCAIIETETLPGLGHLAHEEQPRLVADRIIAIAQQRGLLPESKS
jgi:magnesium chelatase accessory protein